MSASFKYVFIIHVNDGLLEVGLCSPRSVVAKFSVISSSIVITLLFLQHVGFKIHKKIVFNVNRFSATEEGKIR